MTSSSAQAAVTSDDAVLAYALRWRVRSPMPGAHRGVDAGALGHLRQIVPFDRSPDPRRIDLRASLRDPFGGLLVREFEQRTAAAVHVLVDASASMRPAWPRACALARLVATATRTLHDAFGLVVAGGSVLTERKARHANAGGDLDALDAALPSGRGIDALVGAAECLGRRRSLVFVVSDFAFGPDAANRLLEALAAHDTVPLRLLDPSQDLMPRHGLAELRDRENGRRRLVWLRPALHARWREAREAQSRALHAICAAHGAAMLDVGARVDAEALSAHLIGR